MTRPDLTTGDLAGRSHEEREAPTAQPYPGEPRGAEHDADRGPDLAVSRTGPDEGDPGAARAGTGPGTQDRDVPDPRRDDRPGPGAPAASAPAAGDDVPLLDDATADPFLQRWSDVQGRFVDDPRSAVEQADGLVAELMQTLASRFADHKAGLEEQWSHGGQPDTEQLRRALQQYRSFFDRLLST